MTAWADGSSGPDWMIEENIEPGTGSLCLIVAVESCSVARAAKTLLRYGRAFALPEFDHRSV